MNAQQLYRADGTATSVWSCSKCGRPATQDLAEKCCICKYCGKEVGDEIERHFACLDAKQSQNRADRLANAELVENWDGPVFWENAPFEGDLGEGFFDSLAELIEEYQEWEPDPDDYGEGQPIPSLPERVHLCEIVPFKGIDMGRIVEDLTEEMFEDAGDHLVALDPLEKAIQNFNKANEALVTYRPDYRRAVLVPKVAVPVTQEPDHA
jgi:hypothetical protein